MSRDLDEKTIYLSQGGKLPLKWTAPEVSSYVAIAAPMLSFLCCY